MSNIFGKDIDGMKPMMIIPPDTMSAEDIALLRENGVCVVVSKEPGALRFLDPLPVVSSRSQIEHAAIQLSRKLLGSNFWINNGGWASRSRADVVSLFVELLAKGTPLDPGITQQEQEQRVYDETKYDEIRRLAREDAKAERAAKKAEQAAKKSK